MTREEAIERVRTRFDRWALDEEDLAALQALGLATKESEDERIRKIIRLALIASEDELSDFYKVHKIHRKECTDWLEKQKDEAQGQFNLGMQAGREEVMYEMEKEQKPAEWSEEDERNLYNIIEAIKYTFDVSEGSGGSRLIAWLKFHLRPQSHWRPSEEQMRAVFDASERNDKLGSVLRDFYNDLKRNFSL